MRCGLRRQIGWAQESRAGRTRILSTRPDHEDYSGAGVLRSASKTTGLAGWGKTLSGEHKSAAALFTPSVKGAGFRLDQRGLENTEEEGKTRTLENRKGAAPTILFPQAFYWVSICARCRRSE
jgi:hypothetical protein